MKRWLRNFTYRIDIGIGIFIATAISACIIAALTVSLQAVRTVLMNPARSLRYE
ncbi:ABC transporter permease [candidate division KSB1 bacterium]